MDTRSNENFDELPSIETPEDVAVLYSWANLHGAKYRDFSASRREYRAQLRHRAAEQVREVELRAEDDAEAAAGAEQRLANMEPAWFDEHPSGSRGQSSASYRRAEDATRRALAERTEATRHAEAAAQADAEARKEEQAVMEAKASARRQAALYAEAESRARRQSAISRNIDVPGRISDPYTPEVPSSHDVSVQPAPEPSIPEIAMHPLRPRIERSISRSAGSDGAANEIDRSTERQRWAVPPAPTLTPIAAKPLRRPQGYRPDEASGVRQIYRPEMESAAAIPAARSSSSAEVHNRKSSADPRYVDQGRSTSPYQHQEQDEEQKDSDQTRATPGTPQTLTGSERETLWAGSAQNASRRQEQDAADEASVPRRSSSPATAAQRIRTEAARKPRIIEPRHEATPKRRRQDSATYQTTESDRAIAAYRREQGESATHASFSSPRPEAEARSPRAEREGMYQRQRVAEQAGPEWIFPSPSAEVRVHRIEESAVSAEEEQPPPVVDTLQRSRERVASRWYALKGVFANGGSEQKDAPPVRQKETRTPVLAVFSLAGGVGKTSLVATLGRSLSSLGEKVLLTDTTSHGLLPFYFGASELREGTVRTFSPPSGSTDAPIYLVNYEVDLNSGDEEAQEALVEEITSSGSGTHRILLDLTSHTGWVLRRMASLNPTILVPVAPDMNSVISLKAIEKFFLGVNGADGTPLKFFYVLNQFDAALPLHLDVREVLRRQLGERLLPFVIRRAPAVSEALAEGMTIVDYSPEAPVAEDYMNVATWLRAQSAPATAGFRNVRWSER